MAEQIDFVVLWVDGKDPAWQRERARFSQAETSGSCDLLGTKPAADGTTLVDRGASSPAAWSNGLSDNRYRDWELMRYWFRGVERFAPWVHRVFFVTCGQVPGWLNTEHPKLRLVNHRDYIPGECLPTFNSNVIELWLHQIPELGEQFVLFNDDMFLTAPVQPEDFFREGLPCETALMDMATAPAPDDCLPHMQINNFALINRHFNKKEVLRRNAAKFFTLKYGKDLLRNLLLLPFAYFSCFRDSHLPSSYLKSTFERVWAQEGELLRCCGQNRFRSKSDYTHWLMKCWQICEGNFVARSTHWGRHYELWEDGVDEICRSIERQRYRTVCLNDSKTDIAFEQIREKLTESFEVILPDRSAFEKIGQ